MARFPVAGVILAIIVSAVTTVGVHAQATVTVGLGPAVKARLDELGRAELLQQSVYLQSSVRQAIGARHTQLAAVDLDIVDIEPNRPTSAQFGASAQLSRSSFGVGGAAITGEVVTEDGRHIPVRYRFFQDQLRDEQNFTTWGDADQAFDDLAHAIAAGRAPDDNRSWPPVHGARVLTGTRIPG